MRSRMKISDIPKIGLRGLLVWLLLLPSAQAARVGELYSAELLVAEQSVRVDPELVSRALQQVLIKVSGRRDSIEQPSIAAELADSSRYIQRFSYQNTRQPLTTSGGRKTLGHRLTIDFEPSLVDQLLAASGLRPLGALRPGVLVWLLEERDGQREFLGRDEDPAFSAMKQRARERGVPLFRPLLDFEDQQALSTRDAWGFFSETISQASDRYQADSVLVGRLYRNAAGNWLSQWLLIKATGDIQNFESQGAGLDAHLSHAVDLAADRLFANFIGPVGEQDPGSLLLEIDALTSVDDYFQVIRYLQELPAVTGIKLRNLDDDRLLLQLQIEGAASQLRGAIGLNKNLKARPNDTSNANSADNAAKPQNQLNYRWQR
ncbi:MAG: hypothetical protein ACJAWL_002897 [Motiliproteus sp.]